ncbi:hypothetical protein EH196_17740 [Bacillus sp. C1-1]|nr:hypothetical protein EH196_17740 [Bacillus sp. C1-1]
MAEIKMKARGENSLVTKAVDWFVDGLKANQIYEITLTRELPTYQLRSRAVFRSDVNGEIHPNKTSPLSGSYLAVDAMGLFWSMEKVNRKQAVEKEQKVAPRHYMLTLRHQEETLDSISIRRYWYCSSITRKAVLEEGIIGTYFYEKGVRKPTVLIVGGSEGGIYEEYAAALANEGFHTFAIGYFNVQGGPAQLVNIDLDQVENVLQWLKKRPETIGKIGIHGTSRGGELALWSSIHVAQISACVSLNGMRYSMAGIVPWSEEQCLPPAWKYHGVPLPYLTPLNPKKIAMACKELFLKGENPFKIWYEALYEQIAQFPKAKIPLEQSGKPTLLIAGQEDGMFPAEVLTQTETCDYVQRILYPEAGHEIGIPYLPIFATSYLGGRKRETAMASIESWKEVIQFFHTHLQKES